MVFAFYRTVPINRSTEAGSRDNDRREKIIHPKLKLTPDQGKRSRFCKTAAVRTHLNSLKKPINASGVK